MNGAAVVAVARAAGAAGALSWCRNKTPAVDGSVMACATAYPALPLGARYSCPSVLPSFRPSVLLSSRPNPVWVH